jgi:O-antigen/teichoic acid export membrane protein
MLNKTLHTIEKDILNKSIFYSFSIYVRMFLKIISGVMIAKLLGPALFGLKNAFEMTLNYEACSDIGTFWALSREAPYFRGEKNPEKADMAIRSVFTVNVCYAVVAAAILISISHYLGLRGYEKEHVDFILFLGLIILTGKLYGFLITLLKIDKKFQLLSKIQILYGFTASVVGVILVYMLGFRGLLISLVIADTACIACILLAGQSLPRPAVSHQLYWHLAKIGLPIMVLFLVISLMNSADKILILWMISEEALGHYGVATVAAGIIGTIPVAIQSITLTPLMEKYGRTKDRHSVLQYFADPTVLMTYIIPLLVAILYFGAHLPVVYFLDQYIQSVDALKILIFGNYFDAITTPALSICLAFNKQVRVTCIALPIAALDFCLNYILLKAGLGIEGAALGTCAGYFAYFCAISFFACKQFGDSVRDYARMMIVLITPIVYSIFLVWIIDSTIKPMIGHIYSDLLVTILKYCLFVIFYSLVFVCVRRHSVFVKLVNDSFLSHLVPSQIKERFFGDR